MGTMSEQCYLGVDLGAESGRVGAGLFDGRSVRLEQLHRFANGPVRVGDTLRWNVLGLWQGIQDGLAAAADRFGDRIRSVGVDTWGVDYVLMSATDELLGLPWHYRDSRTTGMLATACERVPREEIFAATGLQFMELNTLYQLLAMQRDNPALLDQAQRLLMIPDYFHWLLCGSRVVEFTNATTTQCYDPSRNDWATELLGRFELPSEIFPEVVPPGTTLGRLRDDIAAAAGLDRIDVITPATHDTGSAVAAVPTGRTGSCNWTYISSGTWSLMGAEVPEAVTGPETLAANATNEGGVDGTFRLLKNIMGLWLVQECRRAFSRDGRDVDYGTLTRQAAEADPFVSLVNPDDPSFLKPPCMPTAIRDFCRRTGPPVPSIRWPTSARSSPIRLNQPHSLRPTPPHGMTPETASTHSAADLATSRTRTPPPTTGSKTPRWDSLIASNADSKKPRTCSGPISVTCFVTVGFWTRTC